MDIDLKTIHSILKAWNSLIEKEITNTSEMDISALSSWVKDCFDSYEEVYGDLLQKMAASHDDYCLIYDCVVAIYWHLDHIKKHIVDAENGFTNLMEALSKRVNETQEDG